jgi:Ca2+/Na+ antiporter
MDYEDFAFNLCAFITGLFLLEWSADKFVDHTVIVAKRLGLSPALVSLLTAGAEWEEVRNCGN